MQIIGNKGQRISAKPLRAPAIEKQNPPVKSHDLRTILTFRTLLPFYVPISNVKFQQQYIRQISAVFV
jgi:hypothetical protein